MKPRDVTYQYAGLDPEQVTALTNVGSGTAYASYTYDASGNQTERCYGTMPCAGESTEYVYDGEDRLRRATKKQNGVVVSSEEYWYDGRGSRMATVKRDASGVKTELIWWLADTEGHYDGAGTKQHVYSYVSLGTPVARTDRDGSGTAKLELTFHGLANNTLAAVDRDTGTVDASFSYAPFGEIVEATDAGGSAGAGVTAHRRRMNDKFVDEVSDLAYYGARYYDKTLMTWTQSDPLYRFVPDAAWAQPRRANLYTSDLNNPLRYLDPDGRKTTECHEGGECTTVNSPSDDADEAADNDTYAPIDGSTEDSTGTKVAHFAEAVAIVGAIGLVCQPCAIVVGAGMAAPDGTEGGAMVGAGCATGCGRGLGPEGGGVDETIETGGKDAGKSTSPAQNTAKINAAKQGKHVPGDKNFIPGRSELTHPDPQGLLDRGAGTGVKHGTKEVVDFGEKIGSHVDQSTGAKAPTSRGTIHYDSKGGAHIVPAKPTPTTGPKKIN